VGATLAVGGDVLLFLPFLPPLPLLFFLSALKLFDFLDLVMRVEGLLVTEVLLASEVPFTSEVPLTSEVPKSSRGVLGACSTPLLFLLFLSLLPPFCPLFFFDFLDPGVRVEPVLALMVLVEGPEVPLPEASLVPEVPLVPWGSMGLIAACTTWAIPPPNGEGASVLMMSEKSAAFMLKSKRSSAVF